MQNTEIQLMGLTDTSWHAVAITDEQGRFTLGVKPGLYRIALQNYLFDVYEDTLSLPAGSRNVQFFIAVKAHWLNEVSIVNRPPFSSRGDTTEYVADSFPVMEYGSVEELLRRLPGMDQDENGHIIALGKRVTKITVDGESFFSSDPATVARMLRAIAIDKVQLYDEKEEQAAFSGIDKGGTRTRTLNLVLKENAKQGYLGKIKASGGLPRYFDLYAALNAFEGKRKVATYASISNTGNTPGRFYNGNSNSSQEVKGQQGMSHGRNGGLHYDNKWLGDALTFNGNYQYGRQETENETEAVIYYILPDSQYRSNQKSRSHSTLQHHIANIDGRYIIDTSAYLKFNTAFTSTNGEINSSATSVASRVARGQINAQTQSQQGLNRSNNFEFGTFYGKRFRKSGRIFSAEFKINWRNNSSDVWLTNRSVFRDQSSDSLAQYKDGADQSRLVNMKASYSDVVGKRLHWELAYRLETSNSLSRQLSYIQLQDVYKSLEKLDSLYSSHYRLGIITHYAEAGIKLDLEPWHITGGFALVNAGYIQKDFLGTRNYDYRTLSIVPELRIGYLGKESSGSLVYTGQTRPPTLEQVQPLVQNADPLNVYKGNPSLTQEFHHQFEFNYNTFIPAYNSAVFVNATYTIVQNAISLSQFTDELGRSEFKYINVDDNIALGLSVGYSRDIKELNVKAGIQLETSLSQIASDINGCRSESWQRNHSSSFNFRYFSDARLELSNVSTIHYNFSSVQKGVNSRFIYYQQRSSISYKPTLRIKIETSLNWLLRQKVNVDDRQNSIANWNMSLAYSLLKNRSLHLSCSVQDLLNQNKGFSRTVVNNIIREQSYTTLKRYMMLGLTWDFNYHRKSGRE